MSLWGRPVKTFTNPSEIWNVSFMNLPLGGFGRHGTMIHYSDDLCTPTPIFCLSEFDPGLLWQLLGHISEFWRPSQLEIQYASCMNWIPDCFDGHGLLVHYSGDLHKPVRNSKCSFVNLLLDSFGGRGPIVHYSEDLRKLILNPTLFLYKLAAGRDWWTWRAHVLLFWRPSQTFGNSIFCLLFYGFDRHDPIFLYYDALRKLIGNLTFFLYAFAPGRLWRPGSIDDYSDDLHEPIRNPIFVCITLLPDGFGGHRPIFHHSGDFYKPTQY